ncbi:MAG: hypothetical protein ABI616_02910 [Pseudomonadota bacterium]
MVQLCLNDEEGVAAFKQILQDIAIEQGMRYMDGSGEAMRGLRAVNATGEHMHSSGGLVHVAIEGDDGLGLSAGNLGLNLYDMAIGFSHEPSDEVASHLSDLVVAKLKERWAVKTVPAGKGAFPDPACLPTALEASTPPNNHMQRSGNDKVPAAGERP